MKSKSLELHDIHRGGRSTTKVLRDGHSSTEANCVSGRVRYVRNPSQDRLMGIRPMLVASRVSSTVAHDAGTPALNSITIFHNFFLVSRQYAWCDAGGDSCIVPLRLLQRHCTDGCDAEDRTCEVPCFTWTSVTATLLTRGVYVKPDLACMFMALYCPGAPRMYIFAPKAHRLESVYSIACSGREPQFPNHTPT